MLDVKCSTFLAFVRRWTLNVERWTLSYFHPCYFTNSISHGRQVWSIQGFRWSYIYCPALQVIQSKPLEDTSLVANETAKAKMPLMDHSTMRQCRQFGSISARLLSWGPAPNRIRRLLSSDSLCAALCAALPRQRSPVLMDAQLWLRQSAPNSEHR